MPLMACHVLRAAARVSSAVAAAARSGSGGAAASDPLKHSSSVTAAGAAAVPSHDDSLSTLAKLQAGFVKFEANEKDLESDDALWDLYERWCKFFNEERDREGMARRFSFFKDSVLRVEKHKKSNLPYTIGLNQFADGKLSELHSEGSTMTYFRRPSTSPISGSELLRLQARRPRRRN